MLESLGIKTSTAVAGFLGGVAAMSYLKPSSVWQGFAIVVCGLAGAIYWTPVASHYLGLHDSLEHAAAFTLGVVSMALVAAILTVADQIKKDPFGFFRQIRGHSK